MIANDLAAYLKNASVTLPAPIGVEQAIAIVLEEFVQAEGTTFNGYFGLIGMQPLFAVSLYPERTRLLDGKYLPRALLQTFWRENADLLSDPRCCIGVWYDVEEDVTYIDVSVALADEQQAVELGQRYNQRGIFSFERGVVIDTGGSGAEPEGLPPMEQRLPILQRENHHGDNESDYTGDAS